MNSLKHAIWILIQILVFFFLWKDGTILSEDAVSHEESSTTYGMSAPLSDRHVLEQWPSQVARLYNSSQFCIYFFPDLSSSHSAILFLKQLKPLQVIANFSYFLPSHSSTSTRIVVSSFVKSFVSALFFLLCHCLG